MSDKTISTPDPSTVTRVVVPQHVVYRCFPSETVVLNLQTGKYHGLNPTAGEMLEALGQSGSMVDASAAIASAHELPVEMVETDMRQLCSALLERNLIQLVDAV